MKTSVLACCLDRARPSLDESTSRSADATVAALILHTGREATYLLLLSGAVSSQHLHVAGVRGSAIEHLGGPHNTAHLLRQVSIVLQGCQAEYHHCQSSSAESGVSMPACRGCMPFSCTQDTLMGSRQLPPMTTAADDSAAM